MTENIIELINQLSQEPLKPALYLVATDIGNVYDITLRALVVLQKADIVVCEDRKNGSKLLKRYAMKRNVEVLSEHNEKEQSKNLIEKLISDNLSIALISDGGTPLFADPGNYLVQQCHYFNISVVPVPGASSLMSALMVSGIAYGRGQYFYYGFLPANKQERIQALYKLKEQKHIDIVFLETPYRLSPFLNDVKRIIGAHRKGMIAYKMTTSDEKTIIGTLDELVQITCNIPKGEFVFILFAQPSKKR